MKPLNFRKNIKKDKNIFTGVTSIFLYSNLLVNRNLYLVIFIIFLFFFNNDIKGQTTRKFSIDSVEFNKQFALFFNVIMPEEKRPIIDTFLYNWNTKKITEDKKESILLVLNKMLNYNAKAYPEFTNYLNCFNIFIKNKQSDYFINKWNEGVNNLIEKKIRLLLLNEYFEFTSNLILFGYINKNDSYYWKVTNHNFVFVFEDNPKIIFKNTDLICRVRQDSTVIYSTNGNYYPLEKLWEGEKGKITWQRSGQSRDSMYVNLKKYKLDITKTEYTIDSVLFTNKYYFGTPVLGKLNDKVVHYTTQKELEYPQFEAYDNNYHWSEMYPRIDYDGGFAFKGYKIIGLSKTDDDVRLTFKNNDTIRMVIRSKYISFYPEKINSNKSAVSIYIDKDSIFHPNLSFIYFVDKREIVFNKNEDYLSNAQYINSYHKIYMNFEQVVWNLNRPEIKFTMYNTSAIGNANFKSFNYFRLNEYEKIQGIDEQHPLVLLRNYARMINSETINIIDFAHYINKSIAQTKHLLMRIAVDGYIFYDEKNQQIKINKMLYSTIDARYKKIDYDVINIISNTNNPSENASLNLNTYDLYINGVDNIFLSDSQNVYIFPYGKQIVMKKNRDFSFNGIIRAGLFTFFGKNFYFSYDTFKINMNKIDSLLIKVKTSERDFYNNPVLKNIASTIEKVTGYLLIDDPDNKSGLTNYSEYPIFNSLTNSYVYYDNPNIQKGIYKRDSFYFEIYPYTIDSLDNFEESDLKLNGKFVSTNIFPPFEEKIYVMKDNSLGFVREFEQEGVPIYKRKGKFYNKISLSNNGLKGDGKINYLTSTIISKDITFFPDSMNCISDEFYIAKQTDGIEFPDVSGKNIKIHWNPYKDEMLAWATKQPYTIYNSNTHLEGSLTLKPTGLKGSGNMNIANSLWTSNSYNYRANDFDADTLYLTIYSPTQSDSVLMTVNKIKANYNFNQNIGKFDALEESATINMPENQYIAFTNKFAWRSDVQKVLFTPDDKFIHIYKDGKFMTVPFLLKGNYQSGTHFMSTRASQDSIEFVSKIADFDLNKKLIFADKVDFINIADAIIYPNEGDLYVEKYAVIKPLEKAIIKTNKDSMYHTIYNSAVLINTKHSYQGSGWYDYIDEENKIFKIYFSSVKVDENEQTYATGKIDKEDTFYLSPWFAYIGEVNLYAKNKFLYFNGLTQINHLCKGFSTNWFRFSAEIDPKNIYIPVEETLKNGDEKYFSGLYIATDSVHLYPAFASNRKFYSDVNLCPSSGFLYYDKKTSKYIISSKEKIQNPDTIGQYISLHRKYCLLYGEGDINLGVKYGHFKMTNNGFVNYNCETREFNSDLFMTLDFYISQQALQIMAKDFDSIPGLKPIDITKKIYNKKINQYLGYIDAEGYRQEISLYGKP